MIGTLRQSVGIGAQATRDIVLTGSPPTTESSWAVMKVAEQECVLRTDEN